jgi:AcrR family transcriptional regulator
MVPSAAPAQNPPDLVGAAYALFSKRGFDDVTLDQIAEAAGVTKGSLYHHYDSKHALMVAACNYYYRTYQQRLNRELAPIADPLEKLRHALSASIRSCVVDCESRVFTAEIFAHALQDAQLRSSWAQFYDSVREMYVGLVEAARVSGQLRVRDSRAAVNMMLATIEGIKQRAAFEPEIAAPSQQQAMRDWLIRILESDGAG